MWSKISGKKMEEQMEILGMKETLERWHRRME